MLQGTYEGLERSLGGLLFNTKQNAVQACCEVLGSRTHMVPVVLPVTVDIRRYQGCSGREPGLFW